MENGLLGTRLFEAWVEITVSTKDMWEEIRGIIFTVKGNMFVRFDGMESSVTLGRQIEAESER